MANLIELIVSVVGADKAAGDVAKLNAAITQGGSAAGAAAAAATPKIRSFHDSLADVSAEVRDRLAPQLDATVKQMLAIAVAAAGVRAVYTGIKTAIGDGAEYQRLSLRLGENVRDIVIQEQAFRNAGLSANYLATASNLLDRALSPLNQNARRNKEVFAELGISMDELRMQSFGEQLQTLSAGFAKLPDQASRAEAAMQLFGRYAGGQMLQLLSDPKALELAKSQAGGYADEMERVAAQMNETQRDLSVVNLRFKELWLGVAERLLPAIREISGLIGGMNFIGLGSILGGTGSITAGGLIGMWGIDKLDLKLLDLAEKFKGRITGSFAAGAGKIVGGIADALPPVLGAAIAGSVVFGVITAMADSDLRSSLDRAAHEGRDRASSARLVSSISSEPEAKIHLAQLQATIAVNENRLHALEDIIRMQQAGVISPAADLRGKVSDYFTGDVTPRHASLEENYTAKLGLAATINAQKLDASKLENEAEVARTIAANQANSLKASLTPLIQNLPRLEESIAKSHFQALTPGDQAVSLRHQLAQLQTEQATIPASLRGTQEGKVYQDTREEKILQLKREEADVQKRITEESKKTAEQGARIAILTFQANEKEAEASGNTALARKIKGEIELRQASVQYSGQELVEVNRRIAAEDRLEAVQEQRANARTAIEQQKTALEAQLSQIRSNLAAIEADYRLTDAEKWEARRRELLAEIAALRAAQGAEQHAGDIATDPAAKAIWQKSASDTGSQIGSTQSQVAHLGANPSNFGEQISAQFTRLRAEWTITAASLAHGITTVTASIGSGLSNGLFDVFERRVRTLGQFVGTVWTSIGQSAARMISDMAAKWIMEHTVMAAFSRIFALQEVATKAAATGATVAIHAGGEIAMTAASGSGSGNRSGISLAETIFHALQIPIRVGLHIAGEIAKTAITVVQTGIRIAAVIAESLAHVVLAAIGAMSALASIPYVGPILAIAAMAGILAAGYGLVKGISRGFKVGGFTGAGSDDEEAGSVHANEYVFSASAVRSLGVGRLDALHAAALSGGSGAGGQSSSASRLFSPASARSTASPVAVFLDKSAYLAYLRSDMTAVAHEVYDKRARS